jgi:glutamine synthetase
MTVKETLAQLDELGAQKVKLAITDIDGILRGKIISIEKFKSIAEKGFGFCDVIFGWDSSDNAYDNTTFTGWHTGYPDAQANIDLSTFRQIPWENNLPFFLADCSLANGNHLAIDPRSLLKKIIANANELGFSSFFSQEFEWFNFKKNEPSTNAANDMHGNVPITTGMFGYSILRASQNSAFFHDLFDLLKNFGVPLEGLHTETGPGVYEAAITYSHTLEAADRAVLFKAGVKEIAHRHNIIPTFMAKYHESLPGCSGHVHQSIWDADAKKNLFYDESSSNGISQTMQHYIAGQLYCLPHILPLFAPTINSYKRLVEGAWAPTTLTWGVDNRTVALRALPGSNQSTRLETRVVGSDANPYLATAGCLAAGLYGIKNKLPLLTQATVGNGYNDKRHGILPSSLESATAAMKSSDIAKEMFGEAFVNHFTSTREWECRQHAKAVTDWETKRYFEII